MAKSKAEHRKSRNAIIGQELVDLGSAGVGGGGAVATKAGINLLKPIFGRKIAQWITQGALGGGLGGAAHGFGTGLVQEDKRPIKESLKEGLLGGLAGGSLGLAGGKVVQGINAKKLKNLKNTKILRKAETDFYKDYIQQTYVKRRDLGNIEFTQAGLETVSKQPEAGRNFNTLKKDIQNAKYLGEELPNHPRKDGIIKFHKLEKDGQEFLIAERNDGKKYYMSKLKDSSETQPSRVGTELSNNGISPINKN